MSDTLEPVNNPERERILTPRTDAETATGFPIYRELCEQLERELTVAMEVLNQHAPHSRDIGMAVDRITQIRREFEEGKP